MIRNFISGQLNAAMHFRIFKMLLLLCNTAGLFIYGFLHFILFDFPFDTIYETVILFKLCCVASGFATGLSLVLLLIDTTEYFIKNPKQFHMPRYIKTASAAAVILAIILTACNAKASVGVEKDLNTGLTATYKNIKPTKTLLMMNNEVLKHTDIPLGESFQLINEHVEGLIEKDGKVSAGCSLKITDKNGNVLLDEKDLFAGKDVFDAKTTDYLRCTVSTGKPMAWEEKYDVAVTFWDKYGDGKIENKVSIRCIDIP